MSDIMPDELLEKSLKKLDDEIARVVAEKICESHDRCMKSVSELKIQVQKNAEAAELCSKRASKVDKILSSTEKRVNTLISKSADIETTLVNTQGKINRLGRFATGLVVLIVAETALLLYILMDKF